VAEGPVVAVQARCLPRIGSLWVGWAFPLNMRKGRALPRVPPTILPTSRKVAGFLVGAGQGLAMALGHPV